MLPYKLGGGCVLSPLLFNLYSEAIFREVLEEKEMGIRVNGLWINNIRYADDTLLIVDNIDDLQHPVDAMGQHSKSMGLNINVKKTKFMIVTRESNAFSDSSIAFDAKLIERVSKFKYLGASSFEDWVSDDVITCSIVRLDRHS